MMKTVSEENRIVLRRIANNVSYLFQVRNIKQSDFLKFCKNKYEIEVNSGNFAKMLSNPEGNKMNVPLVAMLCDFFGIKYEELVWRDLTVAETVLEEVMAEIPEKTNLIMNVGNPLFSPYLGQKVQCYFAPTISEESGILHGEIRFIKDVGRDRCRVEIAINTGRDNLVNDRTYTKKYDGIMIISKKTNVCMCLVVNDELGELNMICFRNTILNNTNYEVGMAAVCTASAGVDRVPTMHRMLLCNKEIPVDLFWQVEGNLKLNSSKILIGKEELEEIFCYYNIAEELKMAICSISSCKEYYEINERILRGTDKRVWNGHSASEVIARIRADAYGARYNKISKKLDDNLWDLFGE